MTLKLPREAALDDQFANVRKDLTLGAITGLVIQPDVDMRNPAAWLNRVHYMDKNTLESFKKMWDSLGTARRYSIVPTALHTRGFLRASPLLRDGTFLGSASPAYVDVEVLKSARGSVHRDSQFTSLTWKRVLDGIDSRPEVDESAWENAHGKIPGGRYLAYEVDVGAISLLILPLADATTVPIPLQAAYAKASGLERTSDQRPRPLAPFEKAFPELDSATKRYSDLSIEKIVEILDAELDRAGGDLTILGAKIPGWAIGRVGFVVLVASQLYVLLHLQQFLDQSAQRDPGWEVPWVGFYPSWVARLATTASVALLPAGTSYALLEGATGAVSAATQYQSWIGAAVSAALVVWTLALLLRLWSRQRPSRAGVD